MLKNVEICGRMIIEVMDMEIALLVLVSLSIITIILFVGFIIFAFWLGVHLLAFILMIAFIIWAAGAFAGLVNK